MGYSEKLIIDVKRHFCMMLNTHDPERAATITGLVFDIPSKKIKIICKENIDKYNSHIKKN